MIYLKEMPNMICFLENRLVKLDEKVRSIDAINAQLDGLPIKELIFKVYSIKERVSRTSRSEYGGSLESFLAHMEEHVE